MEFEKQRSLYVESREQQVVWLIRDEQRRLHVASSVTIVAPCLLLTRCLSRNHTRRLIEPRRLLPKLMVLHRCLLEHPAFICACVYPVKYGTRELKPEPLNHRDQLVRQRDSILQLSVEASNLSCDRV